MISSSTTARAVPPSVACLLVARGRQLERAVTAALAGTGVSAAHWFILEHVGHEPETGMTALAACTGLPAPSLTRHVDRLVDDTLVYRLLDSADRRRVGLRLTSRGEEFLEAHRGVVEAAVNEVLGEADASSLQGVLRAFAAT